MPSLSHRALQVYLLLSQFANNKTQECHPNQLTLATRLSCTVRTIQRTLKELEELELIAKRVHRNNRRFGNNYVMLAISSDTSFTHEKQENESSCDIDEQFHATDLSRCKRHSSCRPGLDVEELDGKNETARSLKSRAARGGRYEHSNWDAYQKSLALDQDCSDGNGQSPSCKTDG
jgi:DNA-binding MarR family transcriptional regulator